MSIIADNLEIRTVMREYRPGTGTGELPATIVGTFDEYPQPSAWVGMSGGAYFGGDGGFSGRSTRAENASSGSPR